MPTVTTRLRECLIAASAAASSAIRITVPPWTLPAELASVIPIHRISWEREAEQGFGSKVAILAVPGAPRRQRGACADRARAQERRPDRASVARLADHRAREAARADDRVRAEAAGQDRAVPLEEGGHQGPVLGGRGAGADR